MARKPMKPKQIELHLPTWGGRRRGAGRKHSGPRRRVKHAKRPHLTGREPIHVTWRVREHVWSLRSREAFRRILRAFSRANGESFRLTHYSVQGNHLHLMVEAADTRSLSRGMQGLGVRLARAINELMGTTGSVFADRFHAHVLRSPSEVAKAIAYVLNNFAKHLREQGLPIPPGADPLAAGPDLDTAESRWALRIGAISPPRTWLLRRTSAFGSVTRAA